jgi:hypothetical protein
MEAEQATTWMCPAVEVYEVSADGAVGAPKVILVPEAITTVGRTNTPDLVIVCGPLGSPAARAQAVRISERQHERVLRIAVVRLDDGAPAPAGPQAQELHDAFASFFIVDGAGSEQVVRRLVRAITMPGGPDQWIGCDWNDVRYVVGGTANARPARYGFGRSAGERRATEASSAAIAQIARQGASLADARGLCVAVSVAPPGLYGRELKEAMAPIRVAINPAACVVQCMAYDHTLDAGTMEVDLFAFGECD